MKKQKNKQAIKASKLAKIENMKKNIITVRNAEGEPNTQAEILIQNKIDFTPKVSVIIPVYNVEEYLRECLDSVVNQTLKEIEIICVDDGSTDNSLEILKEYAKKDNRITVITQKNLHAGVARNAGLAVAKGEYLSFLDSDDFFELNMLEETVKIAEQENSDITFYQYKNYNNETKQAEKVAGINKQFPINEKGYAVLQTEKIISQLFTICNPMPWNKLISHHLIKEEKLFFQSLPASNDVYFSQMILACSQKIVLYYKTFAYYRYNRRASLKNSRDKYPLNFSFAYKGIYDTLKNKNLYEKYYRTFLISYLSSALWTIDHTDKARKQVEDFVKENIITKFLILTKNKDVFPENMIKQVKKLFNPKIIISLTSYPARIETVNQTIESLLNQTMKADKVILWLAPEQFPNKEKDLPQQLLDLRDKGLTIDWYHDIKSYKKLIPTLQKYPDSIIVTADDDIIYRRTCLEKLLHCMQNNQNCIIAHRTSRLMLKQEKLEIFPRIYYAKSNQKEYKDKIRKASAFNMQTGCGTVLYPPHCFYKDILDETLIMQLAPTNDDQWFWAMGLLNNFKVMVCANNEFNIKYVPGTQEGECLWKINDKGEKLYFRDLNRILNYYPNIMKILNKEEAENQKTILNIMKNEAKNIYAQELINWYQRTTNKYLNLSNPKTYNEKLQWLKIYNATPIKTLLADKYLVRDWVKKKIGEQYLIPLLGVYDKFEEIDFSKLPNQFVIKCNHGSGWNIIVKDKSKLDLKETKEKLDKWMSLNFAFIYGYELHYKEITPKIIIEEYINPNFSNHEIQCWVFNKGIKFISVETIKDDDNLERGTFYPDGKRTEFEISPNHYKMMKNISSRKAFDKAIELAQKLIIDVPYVRIDFIEYEDDVKFREMTFTSGSGLSVIKPDKYNLILGNMIKLPKLAYNIDTGEYYKLPKKSKIKPYLLLPYNLCQKIYLKRKKYTLNKRQLQKQLTDARIDIKNFGNAKNAVEITTSAKISAPAWFTNAQGQGVVTESNKKIQNITIKAIQNGKLVLSFKGQDKRYSGTRFPLWVDYKSIKIDGKEILSSPVATWHDKPFRYEMPVKDGQVVRVEVVQQYHQYAKEELKDVILKLNPNSDYIKKNINKLIGKIYKKITKYKVSHISQLPIIEADYFIPVGHGCRPAYWLKKYGLRQASYPFDWMISYSLDTVINTIKKGCYNWFSNYTEDKSKINAKVRYVVDNENHITSMHGFPSSCSVDAFLPEFQKTMQRRIERLQGFLRQSQRICILCNREDGIDSLSYFGKKLNEMYPHLNITIVNVVNTNIRKDIEKYDISKKLKIYRIKADDTNEKGADRSINPNFWIGNEKLYEEICSKFKIVKSSPQTVLFAKAKQNIQARIKLWQDKFSFAHKIAPVMDLMQKNQAQMLKLLQDIQAKNATLENKNNELKKEVELLKGAFNTQLSDFKKQQDERSKQLMAIGDRLSIELQRATNELQSAEQTQSCEIKATLSDFIAQLVVMENKLSAELLRATRELQNYGISEISEIRNYCADFTNQLGNTEVRLLNELSTQRETAQQNKNNIISGINQTEQSLHTQVAKFQEMVQEQQAVLDSVQERLEDLSGLKEIDFAQQEELKSLAKELETQKSHLVKEVQNLQNKVQCQYQELNFADLLHDSTKDSPWLKDKSFALYGWAANYGFIYTLFRILDNVQPDHILEMGLGQTSLVTSQYIANNNPEADLDIIENDENWIKVYEPRLAKSQNIKLHQCDIEFFYYEGEQSRKYKELNKITQDRKYNLIIVDGPFGGAQKFPRSNIVELIEHNLAKDFIIMFDDAERAGEKNTIAQVKAKLSAQGIEFGVQQRDALKSQVLVFSKSCEFVRYL